MNKLVGLAILLIGMMLAVGVGATFRYYEAERTITVEIVPDDDEFIDLTPVQQYASLDGGKLVIRVGRISEIWEGMSPNTTYVFEEMFNVSNELWENEDGDFPICVTLSTSGGNAPSGAVKIYAGDYDNPIAGPDSTITFTVYHGQPVSIGMIFNNANLTPYTSYQTQLQVHAVAGKCP